METPKNAHKTSIRKHTPQLSARKKTLFANSTSNGNEESDLLCDILPLKDDSEDNAQFNEFQLEDTLHDKRLSVQTRLRSRCNLFKNQGCDKQSVQSRGSVDNLIPLKATEDNGKENVHSPSNKEPNIGTEEHLQVLFSNSMRLTAPQSPTSLKNNNTTAGAVPNTKQSTSKNGGSSSQNSAYAQKRNYSTNAPSVSSSCPTGSPEPKFPKVDSISNAPSLSIPTNAFYSTSQASASTVQNTAIPPACTITPRRLNHESRSVKSNLNKGVGQILRRRHRTSKSAFFRQNSKASIDSVLKNIRNEKLRNFIVSKQEERAQVEKVHSIFRDSKDPIKMARPLSVLSDTNNNNNDVDPENIRSTTFQIMDTDFSDLESDIDEGSYVMDAITPNEGIEKDITLQRVDAENTEYCASTNRRFFKSGCATGTRKEINITGNIKAIVSNGKLTLMPHTNRAAKRNKTKNTVAIEFSDEQATVNEILKKLDDTNFGEAQEGAIEKAIEDTSNLSDNQFPNLIDYSEFRNRLPYNTNDPQRMKQQHFLLNFLISNNICTERNFTIFIADPEHNKDEATQIVDQLVIVAHEHTDFRQNYSKNNETANEANSLNIENPSNNNCTSNAKPQKLFPLFYGGHCQPLVQKASRLQRNWTGGEGTTQYQIDAGQRTFGAQQCKQCGLVYSIHEPEEEKLHRDYHASLHLLRFKTWIDEDVVAYFREWSADGRILRITESSNPKRKERLLDVLKVVNKELGFNSFEVPKIYVAYLAVRKYQFVGLCLVQPLQKAHKYVCINGVDCCTEEEFEARCGVSRIWVSPLHRRLHIASKLIQAVQLNTTVGEEIPLEKIAFSAPTESGKVFAQKVTGTENFLIYQ